MPNDSAALETFNGKPTKYRFLDGFKNASSFEKVVYGLGASAIVFGWVPIIGQVGLIPGVLAVGYLERRSYKQAKANRAAAEQQAAQQSLGSAPNSAALNLAQMPDLNPGVNPQFQQAEEARRAAAAQAILQGRS